MAWLAKRADVAGTTASHWGMRGLVAVLAWIASQGAFGYQAVYDGLLMSSDLSDPPVPLLLTIEVSLGLISGEARTGQPLMGRGRMSGSEAMGRCDVRGDLGVAQLRLIGSCNENDLTFEGSYTLKRREGASQVGTFKLTKAAGTTEKRSAGTGTGPANRASSSAGTPLFKRCSREQITCLTTCPRGDLPTEQTCVDRCNLQRLACMSRPRRGPSSLSAPDNPDASLPPR